MDDRDVLEEQSRAFEATKEALMKGIAAGVPVLGPFLAAGMDAWRAQDAAKLHNAYRRYAVSLNERVKRLENGASQEEIWEYVQSAEHAAEILRNIDTIRRAREEEKVQAAVDSMVNDAMEKGQGNSDLREFAAVFLRDCTGLDIRVLKALPKPSDYPQGLEAGELSTAVFDTISEHLHNALRMTTEPERALVSAAIARLHALALCDAATSHASKLMPLRRTELGDEILGRITQPA